MTFHFHPDFGDIVHAPSLYNTIGQFFGGEKSLLRFLETQLGLSGYPEKPDYLRIEYFRQALQQHLETENPQAFFAASFKADRFATAVVLLEYRDELKLLGCDFVRKPAMPARLDSLFAVENIFSKKIRLNHVHLRFAGFADRFRLALEQWQKVHIPLQKLVLYLPKNLLSKNMLELLELAIQKNVLCELPPNPLKGEFIAEKDLSFYAQKEQFGAKKEQNQSPDEIDSPFRGQGGGRQLNQLKNLFLDQKNFQNKPKTAQTADGSLLILRTARDLDAAAFLAQWLKKDKEEQPLFLMPELSRALEQALTSEGLPALGILSASLARPSLQALKLAPVFLWEPVDIYKVLEFVTLALKPLDEGLAFQLAKAIAERPGLFNETWFRALNQYLETKTEHEAKEIQRQYDFWFKRRRYRSETSAPKEEILEIYRYLQQWATEKSERFGGEETSLPVLAEQARRIGELLENLPETRLSFLELERIVRTIYEPAPKQLDRPETERFPFVHASGALAENCKTLIWWNCINKETAAKADKWTKTERAFLAENGWEPDLPNRQTALKLLAQRHPVLMTEERLILVVPERVEGEEQTPHLLLGDIEAYFGESVRNFTYNIDNEEDRTRLLEILTAVPSMKPLAIAEKTAQKLHLQIAEPTKINLPETHSPSGLDSIFYYPYSWFFRNQLGFYGSAVQSISGDKQLYGNLAHRFLEMLLKEENLTQKTRIEVEDFIMDNSMELLRREGATLLLYGREPERKRFLKKVKFAAWTLVNQIKQNGWQIAATEQKLEGDFNGCKLCGVADLLLKRGDEYAIVDLKWGGYSYRKGLISNKEDLQLMLYSHLLPPVEVCHHTAYFILDGAKMLARNQAAFRNAEIAGSHPDHVDVSRQVLEKMANTMNWRMDQIRSGAIELRTGQNAADLDAFYTELGDDLFSILEMKKEDNRFDSFLGLL